jgi:endonuclease/exonuclease/phosphatase family metal-dependent hydrolase
MFKVLTFNAAILDIKFLGYSLYRPLGHIQARLDALVTQLETGPADIVFLQEMFHRDKQKHLCGGLQKCYPYSMGVSSPGWKFRLGNELITLSRYPLFNARLLRFENAPTEELRHTSKGFFHMQTELPGLGLVNLINFHMSAGGKHAHPEAPEMEIIRGQQIAQLIDYTSTLDRTILAGDLNAGPEASPRNYKQLLDAGFFDLFVAGAGQGMSWDPDNALVNSGSESHLRAQRIDHIFADRSLFEVIKSLAAKIVFKDHGITTFDGPISISDHYGLTVDMAYQ